MSILKFGLYTPLLVVCSIHTSAALAASPSGPMRTILADTEPSTRIEVGIDQFQGVELDEARDFDGWTAFANLIVPVSDNFQIRLEFPFKTDGDATVKSPAYLAGQSVDIDGDTGVFDQPHVSLQYQFKHAESDGYNLAAYVGHGRTVADRVLNTDLPTGDRYNHVTNNYSLGIRWDKQIDGIHWATNVGGIYYKMSDDLHPGGEDTFAALDFRLAAIFQPVMTVVHPAVELLVYTDFGELKHYTLQPELIAPIGEHVELKGGVAIGLGGNGNELGGQGSISVRF